MTFGSAVSLLSRRLAFAAARGHSGNIPLQAVFQASKETWTEMRSTGQNANGNVGWGPLNNGAEIRTVRAQSLRRDGSDLQALAAAPDSALMANDHFRHELEFCRDGIAWFMATAEASLLRSLGVQRRWR